MKKLFSLLCLFMIGAGMSMQALEWSWSTNEHVTAEKLGDDSPNTVYKYEWGKNGNMSSCPSTRIVVCFVSAQGVSYAGKVYPPKGSYSVNWQEGAGRIACYQTTNNYYWVYQGGRAASWVKNSSCTQMLYYSGDFTFDEGDGGICVKSTNLVLANSAYTNLINSGSINSVTCGTPATYYNVNVVSNNNSYGTVTSTYKSGYVYANNRSQEYKKNSVYTLTATETDGVFVEWQKNGSRISTSNVVDVTIDGNATYTAVFEAASGGTITVNAGSNGQVKLDNGSWGSTFSNTYSGGQSATIAAQANEGYLFYQWTDNASVTNNTNPYNFTVTSTNTYTASFKRAYTITTGVNDEAFGSVGITEPYSNGKYYEGQSITLTATPANSFTSFVKWQKNGVDIAGGASLNVTVNANDTYTAFFSGRNVIDVDIDASYTDRGSIYSLRGYSSDNKYYVDAAFNNSDDALYSLDGITYNSSSMSFTNKAVEGIDQPCGNRVITHLYCYNATGDVYCFNIHWHFPWSGDTNDGFDGGTINTNMTVEYNSTYNAIEVYGYYSKQEWNDKMTYRSLDLLFVTGQRCSDEIKLPVGTYDINCSNEPGTVMSWQSGMSNEYSFAWSQTQGVDHGNKLLDKGTVTVTKSGSTYTIVLNGKNSYNRDMTATMTFDESIITGTIPNYTLNVTTDGHGTAKVYRYDCSGNENLVSNSGSYKQGSYFKLEATPASGYAFDYWTIDGVDEHFTNNPEILDGLYDNAVVTAHFKTAVMHTITINTPTNGTITVMDGETTINNGDQVAEGTTLTVITTPAADYHFSAWTNDGAASVNVDGPKTIGATFAQNDYFLNATYGAGGASVTRDDSGNSTTAKRAGNTVTLTPTAATGYEFVEWTGDGATYMSGNVFIFPTNGTHNTTYNVQATFQAMDYEITFHSNGGTGSYMNLTYTIEYEDIVLWTDEDIEKDGYTFAGWYDNEQLTGSAVTTIAQGSTGNKDFWAKWNANTYSITYKDKGNVAYSGNNEGSLPTSHTYDVPTDLVDGTKDGFTFLGWFTDENCTVSAGSSIAANSITADITLYADWEERVTPEIELYDNITDISEYESILTTHSGQEVNVTLAGRTLAANRWHTLCLPFDYDTDGSALDGRVYELKDCTTDATNGMTITFYPAEYDTQREADIIAGRPYLVWIDQAVTTPLRFEGVTLTTFTPQTVSRTDVDFKANIPQQTLTDKADIFINNNRLYYPKTSGGSILRAFRAYFHIKNANGMSYAQPRVRIVAEGASGETMTVLETDIDAQAETRKYVEDGILIIEREGVRYDAQGKRME